MLDAEIREILFNYIDKTNEKARVFDELVIAKSRADIVAVTPGKITGYEIKSDADSYARLPKQIKNYDRFFDENYLVVGKSHQKSAESHVPAHWGIICVTESETTVLREAVKQKRSKLKPQLRILWHIELENILLANKLPRYKQKGKPFIREKLLEKVPPDLLKTQLCEELFERDYTIFDN